jgi:cytochrome c biogenesis protein CcmG/thiol:disulfide interchange protein DsbE
MAIRSTPRCTTAPIDDVGLGRIAIDYGVYGVPETYVIDRRGVIRYKHIGPLTRDIAQKEVGPLLRDLSAGG